MKNVTGGIVISRPARRTVKTGSIFSIHLMSDLHIGAANVDYRLIQKEIADAVKNKDRVLVNGDVLDLIICQDRKRFVPDVLHAKLQGSRDIINKAIEWAVELLSPAAHLIDMIGLGNHETFIERHANLDPLAIIVHELRKVAKTKDADHVVHYGGYTGFIDYRFSYQFGPEAPKDHAHSKGFRYILYYHHGGGGSSPVTKGMIDFARKDVFVDADVVWLGHKHNRFTDHVCKLSCPQEGYNVKTREVRRIMTGAYATIYRGQDQESIKKHGRRSSWAADMGFAPQGKGGARILLEFNRDQSKHIQPDIRVVQ